MIFFACMGVSPFKIKNCELELCEFTAKFTICFPIALRKSDSPPHILWRPNPKLKRDFDALDFGGVPFPLQTFPFFCRLLMKTAPLPFGNAEQNI